MIELTSTQPALDSIRAIAGVSMAHGAILLGEILHKQSERI
jgi:hypothetical protein